jgi:K+-transporting ATPase ATPase C chain
MESFLASIRIAVVTMAICVAGYASAIWAIAQAITPETAAGSLITRPDGTIVGSRLIAQAFTQPKYFWPRPSAIDYNAAAAGGSNKSPTSTDLTDRARKIVAAYEATPDRPLPAELAAASGAGLDPHVSEGAALYQAARIAKARGLGQPEVEDLVRKEAFASGGFLAPGRIVNVLELNLALDGLAAKSQ